MKPHWTFRDEDFAKAWEIVKPFTMTSPERGYALWQAVGQIAAQGLDGAFVECGCWRGGSAMLMLLAAQHFGMKKREVYLFDTFEGMTPPSDMDRDLYGKSAAQQMEDTAAEKDDALVWAVATLEEVQRNIESLGLDQFNVHFIKGDVLKTLDETDTGPIGLLRLDTDFYDSTFKELEVLYPRLRIGGPMIIDDYGHWQGAQEAVEHFFDRKREGAPRPKPFLWAVDYTGRACIKPRPAVSKHSENYDYVPTGFEDPELISLYPSLRVGPIERVTWPYLRKNTPHIWRNDSRASKPMIGVLSYEEAMLLYNFAKLFAGKPGLEIGCHLAWSTGHLLAAGLRLDVIDPALGDEAHYAAVKDSLDRVAANRPTAEAPRLVAGFSPNCVDMVAQSRGEPYSFAFIDGWHEDNGPQNDAEAVIPYMADDAIMVFHDLSAPAVFQGLRACENSGWKTGIYNTTQIMGVASRGNVRLPDHVADPAMPRPPFPHLQGLPLQSI